MMLKCQFHLALCQSAKQIVVNRSALSFTRVQSSVRRRFVIGVRSMSAGSSSDLLEKLRQLHEYSPCDVSDALLKLQKPKSGEVARAGFLADIGKLDMYLSELPLLRQRKCLSHHRRDSQRMLAHQTR